MSLGFLGATLFPGRGLAEPGDLGLDGDLDFLDEADDLLDEEVAVLGGEEDVEEAVADEEGPADGEGEDEEESWLGSGEEDADKGQEDLEELPLPPDVDAAATGEVDTGLSRLQRVEQLLAQAEQREAAARQDAEEDEPLRPLEQDLDDLDAAEAAARAAADDEEIDSFIENLEAEARAVADEAGEDDFEALPAAEAEAAPSAEDDFEAAAAEAEAALSAAESGAGPSAEADFEAAAAEAEAAMRAEAREVGAQGAEADFEPAAGDAETALETEELEDALEVAVEADAYTTPPAETEPAPAAAAAAEAPAPPAAPPPAAAAPQTPAPKAAEPSAGEQELRGRYLKLMERAAEERRTLDATLAEIRRLEASLGLLADAATAADGIDLRGCERPALMPSVGLVPAPKRRSCGPPSACKAGSKARPRPEPDQALRPEKRPRVTEPTPSPEALGGDDGSPAG